MNYMQGNSADAGAVNSTPLPVFLPVDKLLLASAAAGSAATVRITPYF